MSNYHFVIYETNLFVLTETISIKLKHVFLPISTPSPFGEGWGEV